MKSEKEENGYLSVARIASANLSAEDKLKLINILMPQIHKALGGNRSRYLLIDRKVFHSPKVQRFLAQFYEPAVIASRQGKKHKKKK